MAEPIRVLQFLDDAQPGGGMTHLLQLARWLDPACIQLAFALPGDGPLPAALRDRGFPVFALDLHGRFDAIGVLHLARLCRRERIRILHGHNARASVHARLAGKLARTHAILSTVHNSVFAYDVSHPRQRLYGVAERWTARWATRIVAVSSGIAHDLVFRYGIPADKVVVIPNGIDHERLRPRRPSMALRTELHVPASAPLVVQVGRLTDQKGCDVLLNALARLKTSLPDLVGVLVGDGPRLASLESLRTQLGLADRVRFAGHRDDIPDLLLAADIVVLASRSEGLPYTLLEAMGIGCAVIATRIPGIVDVLRDGENGMLVPPEDACALAEGIAALLGNRDRRLALGQAARAHVLAGFTSQGMAKTLTELYATVGS